MTDAAGFSIDLDEDAIREWYDKILSSRHEGVLADIGGSAYRHVMRMGIDEGLLEEPEPVRDPNEIRDVLQLMCRRPQRRKDRPGESIWFREIGRELMNGRPDDLLNRRCVELPELFEILRIHRNKKAHRGTVTEGSLYALCGTVLMIIELASDEWIDKENIDSLRKAAVGGLDARQIPGGASHDELGRLREALEESQAQEKMHQRALEELTKQTRGARKADLDVAVAINTLRETLKGEMSNVRAQVVQRIDKINEEREEQLGGLRDALTTLRDEVVPLSANRAPVTDDVPTYGASGHGSVQPLTGEMVRTTFRKALNRLATKYDIPYKANVFQPWIVNDALKVAAVDGLEKIEDWWKLPAVQYHRQEYEDDMQRQLQVPGLAEWMMDIYRRVERQRPAS